MIVGGSPQLKQSKTFYFGRAEQRFAIMQTVFKKFPFMLDGILRILLSPLTLLFSYSYKDIFTNFGNLWSSSLLNSVVADACKALQKGQAVGSLLQLIYSSLRFLLAPFVLQLTKMLCSNYSLEPILSINTDKATNNDTQHSELIHIILRTITPPPLVDILKLNVETTVSLSRQFSMPPHLAMYDIISDQMMKLLDTATRKLSNKIITQDILVDQFLEFVEKDPLFPAIQFIDNNSFLMRLFKEDFIMRTLQMPSMTSKLLEMAVELLDGLCMARGKMGVVNLYIVKHFDEHKMTYLNVCLRPLLDLKDPPAFKTLLPDRDKIGQMMGTAKDADTFVLQMTVRVLWEKLEGILKVKNDEEAAEKFGNWAEVFCSLRSRLKCRRNLSALLPPNELHWFDVQMCIFLYRLNFDTSPQATLVDMNNPQFREVWKTVMQVRQKDTYKGLEGMLPLAAGLFAAAKNKSTPDQGAHFIQDIIHYYLFDEEGPSAQDNTLLKIFRSDATTFVSLSIAFLPSLLF
jgi:hypothetical protein